MIFAIGFVFFIIPAIALWCDYPAFLHTDKPWHNLAGTAVCFGLFAMLISLVTLMIRNLP